LADIGRQAAEEMPAHLAQRPNTGRTAARANVEGRHLLIGFAGPRTINATIRVELPKGFQTSEFLLEHGFIDRIVARKDLKSEIARAIDYCGG
jgi:hypothetical protein